MNHFIQLVLDGLFVGSFYALVALGYSMVYGIIKLLNFAHGDIYMLGAFAGFTVLSVAAGALGSGIAALVVVMLIAMVATGSLGIVLERVAYRPLRNAPRLSVLITAIGASFALEYGVAVAFGPNPEVYTLEVGNGALNIAGARLSDAQLAMMVIAVALMVALDTLVRKTRSGRAMRAIAQDPKACLLMGIKVDNVISRTFFIGSALAGAAGVMAGAYYGKIDFLMGFIIGLKAFTAAVIGGIGNLRGAMLGAIVLGLLESFGVAFFGSEWRDVFAFGFLILFLTVRPTGLLGERVTERV
ncbi:ABC transporter permease [Streptomyces sp. CNQ-509]|uniref:branched-chain amino acid ABC transporter permease n=1 Tax=unclassified Streptomyces TaxID=2593676 RepID=UPI00062E0232|nr:branched-chain amino acid ABC transporter permease [Streptomyces sp. CNQ-509]AKH86425.1 ABC transporter permease [Streptomyces sp. CNQ-509]